MDILSLSRRFRLKMLVKMGQGPSFSNLNCVFKSVLFMSKNKNGTLEFTNCLVKKALEKLGKQCQW